MASDPLKLPVGVVPSSAVIDEITIVSYPINSTVMLYFRGWSLSSLK